MRRGLPGLSRPRRPPEKIGGKKRLNLALIVPTLVASFSSSRTPDSPRQIVLCACRKACGARAALPCLGGFYLLLAAGRNLLAEKFRIKRYKFSEGHGSPRWRVVLFLGMATDTRC